MCGSGKDISLFCVFSVSWRVGRQAVGSFSLLVIQDVCLTHDSLCPRYFHKSADYTEYVYIYIYHLSKFIAALIQEM